MTGQDEDMMEVDNDTADQVTTTLAGLGDGQLADDDDDAAHSTEPRATLVYIYLDKGMEENGFGENSTDTAEDDEDQDDYQDGNYKKPQEAQTSSVTPANVIKNRHRTKTHSESS